MKRFFLYGLFFMLPVFCRCEDMSVSSQPIPVATAHQAVALEIGLKIDALSDEQTREGLNEEMLRTTIENICRDSGITINQSLSQPTLSLKIRTIRVGLDLASFFQLSLLEDAMLVRNRAMFVAPTWTQASLLSCRPEDLRTETLDTVTEMTKTFSKDFVKAFQPIGS